MTHKHTIMNSEGNPMHINNILKISTVFGLVILSFDFFLLAIHRANIADANNFWVNVKYLIWAIGIFYALKWLHIQNPQRSFFSYLGFAMAIASFVSLFDIFFYLLYTQVINPGIKDVIIESMIAANKELFTTNTQLPQDIVRDMLRANFGGIFSFSLYISYIFLFLFYAVFFTAFLKLTSKNKKI